MRDFTETLYKCPNCGSYISHGLGSFSDRITILRVYSDGYEITTEDDYFDIVECGKCKNIVKLSQLETIEVDLHSHKVVKKDLDIEYIDIEHKNKLLQAIEPTLQWREMHPRSNACQDRQERRRSKEELMEYLNRLLEGTAFEKADTKEYIEPESEPKQTEPIVENSYCRSLDISGLYKAIKEFPEDELAIRLRIWRKYNDVFRPNSSDAYEERFSLTGKDYNNNSIIDDSIIDTKEYRDNCFALLKLLNKDNTQCVDITCPWCGYDNIEPDFNCCPICSHSFKTKERNNNTIYRGYEDERLLLAEINRNLGNFAECAELVRHSAIGESIEMIQLWECEKNNRSPIRIDNYFEILREKARQEAERKEQEWLDEEMKDPRWKVCPNGHCFENIRKECIWCGEKRFVERLSKDVCIQHKELYVGNENGIYILTTDANVSNQEERIRKITVDYYQDKFIYFHMDGKNPHPFNFNKIKLNEGSINGRILTKLCEDIVVGKIDYADLSPYIKVEISK